MKFLKAFLQKNVDVRNGDRRFFLNLGCEVDQVRDGLVIVS